MGLFYRPLICIHNEYWVSFIGKEAYKRDVYTWKETYKWDVILILSLLQASLTYTSLIFDLNNIFFCECNESSNTVHCKFTSTGGPRPYMYGKISVKETYIYGKISVKETYSSLLLTSSCTYKKRSVKETCKGLICSCYSRAAALLGKCEQKRPL